MKTKGELRLNVLQHCKWSKAISYFKYPDENPVLEVKDEL